MAIQQLMVFAHVSFRKGSETTFKQYLFTNVIASLSPSFRTQKRIPKKGSPLPKGSLAVEQAAESGKKKKLLKVPVPNIASKFFQICWGFFFCFVFWGFFLTLFRTHCTVLTDSIALKQKTVLVPTLLYPVMKDKEQRYHMFKQPKLFSQLKYLSLWHLGARGVKNAHSYTFIVARSMTWTSFSLPLRA